MTAIELLPGSNENGGRTYHHSYRQEMKSTVRLSSAPSDSRPRSASLLRRRRTEQRLLDQITALPAGPQRDELLVMAQRAHR